MAIQLMEKGRVLEELQMKMGDSVQGQDTLSGDETVTASQD